MDFDKELQELKDFATIHFPPRRPVGHVDGTLHPWELGPEIHNFRHRAEQFFLASGYLDELALEKMRLTTMMPDQILDGLNNAHLYEEMRRTL